MASSYNPTIPWKGADFIGDALKTFLFSRGSAPMGLIFHLGYVACSFDVPFLNTPLNLAVILWLCATKSHNIATKTPN